MANVILQPNETAGVFGAIGSTTVFGTIAGTETVTVAGNGKVAFVNAGGNDIINIQGNAGDYTATVSGSNLVLTAANGANIAIPFNPGYTTTVNFADAAGRNITFAGGQVSLGAQVIGGSGASAAVAAGSGGSGGGDDNELFFTANTDNLTGTSGDDLFIADMNQVNGLTVNTLGTGDRANGGAGLDALEAQITRGSTYGDGNAPVQPRLNNIEIVKLDAMQSDLPNSLNNINTIASGANTQVYFDASNVRGHTQLWSWNSDADLIMQNITTIVSNGGHDDARNTSDIAIGMGYTGSNNHNWDASDLRAYFDPDFLLSGQTAQSKAFYFLLDEDADLVGRAERLFRINVDGLRFQIDGGPIITLRDPAAQTALTHANFVAALQDELQDLIDAGVVPADLTLTLDPTITETTFIDDGSESLPIPAMVLATQTAAVITPVGFSQVQDAIGEYDVYGRFNNEAGVEDLPVSVTIALEKAGRAVVDCCDAGVMIVGAMDKENQGIPVFNVVVFGDDSRPSTLKYLDSTGGVLDVINITSSNDGFPGDSFASLWIGATNYGMSLIDATQFRGDLTLGAPGCCGYDYRDYGHSSELFEVQLLNGYEKEEYGCDTIWDLATLVATGGGDVTFFGGIESSGVYNYTTGSGSDSIYVYVDGEALDRAGDSLRIDSGSGDDFVAVDSYFYQNTGWENDFANHIILRNVDIITGTGNDVVELRGEGSFRVSTGDDNDVVYSDQASDKAIWVFNVDMGALQAQGGAGGLNPGSLPGVPLQRSFIGGGTLRVTFSGAGVNYDGGNGGGGVGERNGLPGDEGEALWRTNGYESSVTINVAGPLNHYGTQADINDAMLRAINDDAVLNKLLVASIADNNTLVVRSLISGEFVTEDLDIQIVRPQATAQNLSAVTNEGVSLGIYTSNATPDLATINAAAWNASQGQGLSNSFYFGINNNLNGGTNDAAIEPNLFSNLHRSGSRTYNETDHIFNLGAGNDVLVLSTNNDQDYANSYWSLDGQLMDDASNEVIVMNGENFGRDTIVNFVVAGREGFSAGLPVDVQYAPQPGGGGPLPAAGFDFLDFTAYLTSRVTASGSGASGRPVLTTLEDYSGGDVVQDFNNVTLNPNEVVILDFLTDAGNGEFFAGLTASAVQSAINNVPAFTEWGNFDGGEFSLSDTAFATGPGSLIGNAASAVIMVQNDRNLGEYKVFQVTWTDNAGNGAPPVATVVERGQLDFGASLEGIDDINFILSAEALLHDGFGLNQFGPDSAPFIA